MQSAEFLPVEIPDDICPLVCPTKIAKKLKNIIESIERNFIRFLTAKKTEPICFFLKFNKKNYTHQ